jgi:hypothetical protein
MPFSAITKFTHADGCMFWWGWLAPAVPTALSASFVPSPEAA